MLVRELFQQAATELHDFDQDRWPWESPEETSAGASLVTYLNESLRRFVLLKPHGHARSMEIRLQPGALQAVPQEAAKLLGLTRNLVGLEKKPGRIVNRTTQAALDAYLPGWSQMQTGTQVTDWCFDALDERSFWVFPPVPTAPRLYVEAKVAMAPRVASAADVLPVSEQYSAAILHCMLGLVFSGDTESATAQSRAANHTGLFLKIMGVSSDDSAG